MRCIAVASLLGLLNGCWVLGDLFGPFGKPTPEEMIGWLNYPGIIALDIGQDGNGTIYIRRITEDGNSGLSSLSGAVWREVDLHEVGVRTPIRVQCIERGLDGRLFVGTDGQGLLIYNNESWARYTRDSGLVSDTITAVDADCAGETWVGTHHGINRLSASGCDTFTVADGLPDSVIHEIKVSRSGIVMCITGKGFARYDGTQWVPCSPQVLEGYEYRTLARDSAGQLWTDRFDGEGRPACFYRYSGGTWEPLYANYDGPRGPGFAFDRDNHLWFSVFSQGVAECWEDSVIMYNSYWSGQYNYYGGNCGLLDRTVWKIFVDDEDNKWFCTNSGISRYSL